MTGIDPRGPAAKIRIREARPRDLPAIARVESASYSTPWSLASLGGFVAQEGALFLVAEEAEADRTVVGHGILRWAADEGELANLAVAPDRRGRGIGGAILDGVLRVAPTLGLRSIFLEVRRSNDAALALYESRGFRRVGVREQYYDRPPEDAWILRRDLPSDRPLPSDSPGSPSGMEQP